MSENSRDEKWKVPTFFSGFCSFLPIFPSHLFINEEVRCKIFISTANCCQLIFQLSFDEILHLVSHICFHTLEASCSTLAIVAPSICWNIGKCCEVCGLCWCEYWACLKHVDRYRAGRPVSGQERLPGSAANRLIGEVVQSRRRPLLGPSPGWKRLLALPHLRHY